MVTLIVAFLDRRRKYIVGSMGVVSVALLQSVGKLKEQQYQYL